MKKLILKSFISAVVFGFTFLFILYLGKARQTTNPTPTDDGAGMYVTNGNTLTAAKRNNLVNRSAFRAYLNSSQTIASANSPLKINMSNEQFDTNNEFDTSTAKFTPKRAGKYILTANCYFNAIGDAAGGMAHIYKNGVEYAGGTFAYNGSAGSNVSVVTALVDANGTSDYFEVYCHTTKASVSVYPGDSFTYFQGYRVE